ncbi:MAG TPA: hypothetical protein VE081_13420 [Sporichthyaceae bacterium]|nr:hypothetical protein [Sporichthyaceae bacterium]
MHTADRPRVATAQYEQRRRPAKDPLGRVSVGCGLFALVCAVIPPARTVGLIACFVGILLGLITAARGRRHRRDGVEIAWAGLVLAVLSGVGLVASQAAFGEVAETNATPGPSAAPGVPAPSPAVRNVLGTVITVSFGAPRTELEDTGKHMVSVPVTVTNVDGHGGSYDLTFQALDSKGRLITTDTAYVPNLAGRQSAQLRVFTIVNDTLVAQLMKAQFRVVEAVAN